MLQKFKRNLLETSLSAYDDATVGRQFAHITQQRRAERLHLRCHVPAVSCGRNQGLALTDDRRPTGETLHSRFRAAYNDTERSRLPSRSYTGKRLTRRASMAKTVRVGTRQPRARK